MPKLRKLRRKQKFQHDRNRKRIKKSQDKYKKDNIKVSSEVMQNHWNHKDSIKTNLEKMGVAFDANSVVQHKSTKKRLMDRVTKDDHSDEMENHENNQKKPTSVIKRLEEEVIEAEKNIKQTFRFPSEQAKWIEYCIDKHGDDFKAMARDSKNIWQETPKQIRQKVLKFMSTPAHYDAFAKERGLLEDTE